MRREAGSDPADNLRVRAESVRDAVARQRPTVPAAGPSNWLSSTK
jgi:hypothetical protein